MNDKTSSSSVTGTITGGDTGTTNPMNLTCTAQIPTLTADGDTVLMEYVIVMADVEHGAPPPQPPDGAQVFIPPNGSSASVVFDLNGDGPDGGHVHNKPLKQAGILVYSAPTTTR